MGFDTIEIDLVYIENGEIMWLIFQTPGLKNSQIKIDSFLHFSFDAFP